MRVIDFDQKYMEYVREWMRANADRFRDADDMEAHAEEAYTLFQRRKVDWLDGLSPEEYFDAFTDAAELADALRAYEDLEISPPEMLLNRIVALGADAVAPLMTLAGDEGACACLRATALNLLGEMESEAPLELCLRLIDAGDGELAEVAADVLQAMGERAKDAMLKRVPSADDAARVIYLDLLCNFPGDERIYTYVEKEFLRNASARALLANDLAKLGDARAIAPLKRVMDADDVDYLDYLEIANAIEALGGDAGERDRAFDGDPAYESMRNL